MPILILIYSFYSLPINPGFPVVNSTQREFLGCEMPGKRPETLDQISSLCHPLLFHPRSAQRSPLGAYADKWETSKKTRNLLPFHRVLLNANERLCKVNAAVNACAEIRHADLVECSEFKIFASGKKLAHPKKLVG